jgi:hypothetical protein
MGLPADSQQMQVKREDRAARVQYRIAAIANWLLTGFACQERQ